MLSKTYSLTLLGIRGGLIEIETDISAGMPSYDIVGLPDAAVKESKDRVRSAIKNSGYDFPQKKITLNLAPADTKKEGAYFYLAAAVGIMSAYGSIPKNASDNFIILGELSLDGGVRRLNGILPLLLSGLEEGYKNYIIPEGNAKEASYISGINVYPVENLKEVAEFLSGEKGIKKAEPSVFKASETENIYGIDLSEVKGQLAAKRAIEIAVCGGHNILLNGPPGTGKTMLAKCVPTIMPKMTFDEAVEVTKIHSVAGILDPSEGVVTRRPFRTPHHTATVQSLTGGGPSARPGEISLAHNGVLFLDELPEYTRKTIETLRQPLEDGKMNVTRVRQSYEYPSKFMLVASMNPCPCGNYGSAKPCTCTPAEIRKYTAKLSGPLMDRIDIHVEVDGISYSDLRSEDAAETSAEVRARVERAREIQKKRFAGSGTRTNAGMSPSEMKKFCKTDRAGENLLEQAYTRLELSARAGTRILKVARTIADLEGAENISAAHIAEAVKYRASERKARL